MVGCREVIWRESGKSEWTGKVEIRTKKKFLAVGKACEAIKGEHLSAQGSEQNGP